MSDESFSLPGSSYKQLEKIITSYSAVGSETGPAEVASLAGTDSTNVSRNNKFLVATGLVQGKQKKAITPLGQRLAKAIEYEQVETQSACWAEIVERTEFLQKILSAVRIRRGMDSASLVNHIAFSAGAAKNAATMAGAGAVLEIFVISRALKDEGGVLVAPKELRSSEEAASTYIFPLKTPRVHETLFSSSIPSASGAFFENNRASVAPRDTGASIVLNINLDIQCGIDDLDSVGIRLQSLLAQIQSQQGSKQEQTTRTAIPSEPEAEDQE